MPIMKNDFTTLSNKRRLFLKKSAAGILGLVSMPTFASKASSELDPGLYHDATDDALFALVRKQLLLDSKLVYLNTGSLGPSPRLVVDKVQETVHKLERNPVTENWGDLGKEMENVRQVAAQFINAGLDEIILTRNTTEGLNMIGSSLNLKKGEEILTTNHEHGGGEVGLEFLAERVGANIRKISMPLPATSKEQIIDLVNKSITTKTKVLLLSHVVTITGLRMPLTEISRITKEKGILFIVDGAQAPGMLAVDVKQIGADIYATSGHKWLMGPKETGFIYISKEVQERIEPVFISSGYGSYSASSGTRNVANIIGLGEAMAWHELIGKRKIEARVLALSAYCKEKLAELKGLEIISPEEEGLTTALVSARLLAMNNREIYLGMRKNNIVVKVLPQYNALRFSTHMFNTKEDINKMVEQLQKLLHH